MKRIVSALILSAIVSGCAGTTHLHRVGLKASCTGPNQSMEQCVSSIEKNLSNLSAEEFSLFFEVLTPGEDSAKNNSQWSSFLKQQENRRQQTSDIKDRERLGETPIFIGAMSEIAAGKFEEAPAFPDLPPNVSQRTFASWISRILQQPVCFESSEKQEACFGNTPLIYHLATGAHRENADINSIRALQQVESQLSSSSPEIAYKTLSSLMRRDVRPGWANHLAQLQFTIGALLVNRPEMMADMANSPFLSSLPELVRRDGGLKEKSLRAWVDRIHFEKEPWIRAGLIAALIRRTGQSWEQGRIQPLCNEFIALRTEHALMQKDPAFNLTTEIELGLMCADEAHLSSLFKTALQIASEQPPIIQLSVFVSLVHNWMQVQRPPHLYARFTRAFTTALNSLETTADQETFQFLTQGLVFLLEGSNDDRNAVFEAVRWMDKKLRTNAPEADQMGEFRPVIQYILQCFLASLQARDGQVYAAHQTLDKARDTAAEIGPVLTNTIEIPLERLNKKMQAMTAIMGAVVEPLPEHITAARRTVQLVCEETVPETEISGRELCLPFHITLDELSRKHQPGTIDLQGGEQGHPGYENLHEEKIWAAVIETIDHLKRVGSPIGNSGVELVRKWRNARVQIVNQVEVTDGADPALSTLHSLTRFPPQPVQSRTILNNINDWEISCSRGVESRIPLLTTTLRFSVVDWILNGQRAWNLNWFHEGNGQETHSEWECQLIAVNNLNWTTQSAIRRAAEVDEDEAIFHRDLITVVEIGALLLPEAAGSHRQVTQPLIQKLRNEVTAEDFGWLSIIARAHGHLHTGQELEELYREIKRQQTQLGIPSNGHWSQPKWLHSDFSELQPVVGSWFEPTHLVSLQERHAIIDELKSPIHRYTLKSVLHAITGDLPRALKAIRKLKRKTRNNSPLLSLWESVATLANQDGDISIEQAEEWITRKELASYPGELAGTALLTANILSKKGHQEHVTRILNAAYKNMAQQDAGLHGASLLQLLLPSSEFSPTPEALQRSLRQVLSAGLGRLDMRELVQLRILLIKSNLMKDRGAETLPILIDVVKDLQTAAKIPPFLWTFRALVAGMLLTNNEATDKDVAFIQENIPVTEVLSPTREYLDALLKTPTNEERKAVNQSFLNTLFGIPEEPKS